MNSAGFDEHTARTMVRAAQGMFTHVSEISDELMGEPAQA
jgi:hypothetical protein